MCKTNVKSSIKLHVASKLRLCCSNAQVQLDNESLLEQSLGRYSVVCWHMPSLDLVTSVSYKLVELIFFHSVVEIEGVSGQGMWNAKRIWEKDATHNNNAQ